MSKSKYRIIKRKRVEQNEYIIQKYSKFLFWGAWEQYITHKRKVDFFRNMYYETNYNVYKTYLEAEEKLKALDNSYEDVVIK